nr:FliH/SctL family protein [Candidatus Krumholzibacteria bacterium]
MSDRAGFESGAKADLPGENTPASRFRSESGFTDTQTLLSHLTRKERAQLFDLVEQDVSKEYEVREEQVRKECEDGLAEAEKAFHANLENLTREFQETMVQQVKAMAAASSRLALQLAEKVVRAQVAVDPGVLTRALEITHYKLLDSTNLTVIVNPEDESWVAGNTGLRESLRISTVQADRRVERGGCIIKTQTEEWDATITGQFETLAELVEEAISTNTEPLIPIPDPEAADVE